MSFKEGTRKGNLGFSQVGWMKLTLEAFHREIKWDQIIEDLWGNVLCNF